MHGRARRRLGVLCSVLLSVLLSVLGRVWRGLRCLDLGRGLTILPLRRMPTLIPR